MRTTPIPRLAWKFLLVLGTVVGVVLLVVGEESYHPSPEDPGRAPLGSLDYWLGGGLQMGIIGAGLLALVAPRFARWWLLALAPTIFWYEQGTPGGVWFLGLWLLVAVLSVVDVLQRWWLARQDDARKRTAAPLSPEVVDAALDDDGIAFHGGPGILVPLLIGAALTAGVLVWHAHEVAEVRAYEASAHRVMATVVRSDIDEGVTVRLDGKEHTITSAVGDHAAGERVEVLVDPLDANHVDLVLEPVDPSWLLGWAQVPVALGLAVAITGASIGRRRRVLGGGAAGLDCHWTRMGEDPVLVVDGRIIALLRNLEPARPWPADEDDLDDEPWEDDEDLDDDEAAALGDEMLALQTLDEDAFGPDLPMGEDLEPVTLYGRAVVGESVVVSDGHGELHAAELDDAWPWSRIKARLAGEPWQLPQTVTPPTGPGPSRVPARGLPADDEVPAPPPLSGFDRWRRIHGGVVAWWLVVPAAVGFSAVARWAFDDPADPPGWWRLLLVLLIGSSLMTNVGGLVQDLVTPGRPGVRVRGRLLDQVFTRAEVARVLAGAHAVTMRLKGDRGFVTIDPRLVLDPSAGPEGELDPAQARELVRAWAEDSPVGERGRRIIGPGLAALLLHLVLSSWWMVPHVLRLLRA